MLRAWPDRGIRLLASLSAPSHQSPTASVLIPWVAQKCAKSAIHCTTFYNTPFSTAQEYISLKLHAAFYWWTLKHNMLFDCIQHCTALHFFCCIALSFTICSSLHCSALKSASFTDAKTPLLSWVTSFATNYPALFDFAPNYPEIFNFALNYPAMFVLHWIILYTLILERIILHSVWFCTKLSWTVTF